MKLLFYNHTPIVSGAERVLLLILSQLDPGEFDCVVLCPRGALQPQVEAQGVPCLIVKPLEARFTWRPDWLVRYLLSFVRVMRELRAQVKAVNPDLIHANSIRAGLVMTAATIGWRVPVVWHLHDLLPHHPISTAIRCFTLGCTRLRFLAVSEATARRFRGVLLRLRRTPVRVILNCADTAQFQPDDARRQTTRAALGLAETTFAIGTIGQITARKNQLGLLQAFARIAAQVPHARLLIVGAPLFTEADQQYHRDLHKTAEALGLAHQVQWLGARGDVPDIMRALDVLVVNSLAEPCGLVVLEGMASALPLIVTAVGGNPEMVQHGISGWWVPAPQTGADEKALADALLMMEELPALRARCGQAARRRVLQQFTVDPYLTALRQFYRASALPVPDERTRAGAPAATTAAPECQE